MKLVTALLVGQNAQNQPDPSGSLVELIFTKQKIDQNMTK